MTTPSLPHRGRMFWGGMVVGWAIILFGIRGLFMDRAATTPAEFAKWFIGLAIVHDAFLAPAVFTVAWLAGRVLPRRAVVPVRLGLATSGLLILYAWPLARGYGRRESNPSALPLDYGRNLVVSLITIWILVGLWIAIAALQSQRRRAVPQVTRSK
ncbi:MAG: hypothetical protein ABIQ73_04810 [Acidimicrobiales bacterium]